MTTCELDQYHSKVDNLEKFMLGTGAVIDLPLVHRFTPGIYTREIFNPAGSLITTKVHAIEHPFVVLQGRISVYTTNDGVQHIEAPHIGVTKAGTRRVIYAHEDTVFITFHPNPDDTQDLDLIESRLIERRELEGGKTAHELALELMHSLQEITE